MFSAPLVARGLPLGVAYFVAASLALALTRYDGGVAFLWCAASLLIADLMTRPRRQWLYSLVPCAIASGLATGLFGLGWAAAAPFIAINMIEACLAAWLLRRHGLPFRPLGSLSWLSHFVASVGFVAPLVCAGLAAATLWALGKPPGPGFVNFFAGHALGNITFTPLALLIAHGSLRKGPDDARRRDSAENCLLMSLVVAVCTTVFLQTSLPLLFLPILPIILVAFRIGRGGAALAIVVLALVGGGATMLGLGPIELVDASFGAKLQFFQFYLAATVLTVLPVTADLQNRARLHRGMRQSEERYRLLAEHSTDILLHIEIDGRIRYVSPSIRQLGGYDPALLVGQNSRILIAPEHVGRVRAAHLATLAAAGETKTFDYLALTADGTSRWFETHSRAILDDHGRIDGLLSIVRDISARKANEQRLEEAALTDALTGLPNRRAYRSEIERLRPAEEGAFRDCVAVLDIDHFKSINDRFGHDAGDEVLRSFAQVARRMVREGDILARIGGEEFAIYFFDTSAEQAMLICDRLRSEVARSRMRVGASFVQVTVSGGVGRLGNEGVDHALKIADRALYRAKRNGRDQLALAA